MALTRAWMDPDYLGAWKPDQNGQFVEGVDHLQDLGDPLMHEEREGGNNTRNI